MLDPNAIYERDCAAGMKEIAPGSVDLAFADPPFNIGYDYDVYHDKRAAEDYLDWSKRWGEQVVRVAFAQVTRDVSVAGNLFDEWGDTHTVLVHEMPHVTMRIDCLPED